MNKPSVVCIQVSTYYGRPAVVVHRNGPSRIYRDATMQSIARIIELAYHKKFNKVSSSVGLNYYC